MVELISIGAPLAWQLGPSQSCDATPQQVADALERAVRGGRAHALLWDAAIGPPPATAVLAALERTGDVHHAGLELGTAGQPDLLVHVQPTWMLACDPPRGRIATSWRATWRACLLRLDAVQQLGGLDASFASLDAAMLELGHRWICAGAIARTAPELVAAAGDGAARTISIPIDDQLRFLQYRYGRRWARWAALRAAVIGAIAPATAMAALVRVEERAATAAPSVWQPRRPARLDRDPSVTVLIPTLDRPSWLRRLLVSIRAQTVQPNQILIVDQSSPENRSDSLREEFPDLPIQVQFRDSPGQCSSRNQGLLAASGEYIFFADDDSELPPDALAAHLQNLAIPDVEVSSGVVHEVGQPPPLPHPPRVSDVFPMGNTMMRRSLLERSGLLDLAYEHGARADGDFGMRAYLSGALMLVDGRIIALHFRAPRGGLRAHGARTITFGSSRSHVGHRHLPSRTEVYLAKRYFSESAVREMLVLRALGTLRLRGTRWRQLQKVLLGAALLPDSWRTIRLAEHQAAQMMREYPQIPEYRAEGGPRG